MLTYTATYQFPGQAVHAEVLDIPSTITSARNGARMSRIVSTSRPPVEVLENLYEVRQPEEVRLFLDTYQFLLPLIEEAHGRIQERFPASRVFLQMLHDPEEPANAQLIAFVATDCDPAAAFKKLQELDESWWLTAMDRAQGKFQINVEPR